MRPVRHTCSVPGARTAGPMCFRRARQLPQSRLRVRRTGIRGLSRRGRLWSYTENRYAPPPPYPAGESFEPFAVAAVTLDREG